MLVVLLKDNINKDNINQDNINRGHISNKGTIVPLGLLLGVRHVLLFDVPHNQWCVTVNHLHVGIAGDLYIPRVDFHIYRGFFYF
jgi:hypothetical protein